MHAPDRARQPLDPQRDGAHAGGIARASGDDERAAATDAPRRGDVIRTDGGRSPVRGVA